MTPSRVGAAVGAVALVAAACSSPPEVDDPPPVDDPVDSTPAPDATQGVADELSDFYTQSLHWSACGDDFQCATLTVPLDYDDPEGETIELEVVNAPAMGTDPNGSLVVNPGGPGASGVEYARALSAQLSDTIREEFAIVGFDPRGVGTSSPVDCVDDSELDEFIELDGTPDDDADLATLDEQIKAFTEECEDNSGDLLPHLGTGNVVRDLDVLRAALGDTELTYLGKSYGTLIGARYAEQFPDRVGRLVLDGAIDPGQSAQEFARGQAEAFEAALNAFVAWCLDDSCPLGDDKDDVIQAITDLFARVDSDPLPTGDDDRPLSEPLAFYGLVTPFYWTSDQGYPATLEALDEAINDDDGARLLEWADLYLDRNSDGTYNGNSSESFFAVSCLDHPESTTAEQAEQLAAEYAKVAPVFGPSLAWGGQTCAQWPIESDAEEMPVKSSTTAPIVVVGTTGDPATPYEWAKSLADQLPTSTLLTFDGTGHTAYISAQNSCVDQAVESFLLTGTPPDDGATCE